MKNEQPKNECGGCTACCVVMPVLDQEFCKPAGEPCKHLCEGGCGIYANRPEVCRIWHCLWRWDGWLGGHPDYRPDKLGVMFSWDGDLAIWEVTPGALDDPHVAYIKNRLKGRYKNPDLIVKRFPLGLVDLSPTPDMVSDFEAGKPLMPSDGACWKSLGGNEFVLAPKDQA